MAAASNSGALGVAFRRRRRAYVVKININNGDKWKTANIVAA